jgi:hypothetical protein
MAFFSIIVPTLWACQDFPANIVEIAELALVKEVIIIDNNSFSRPAIEHHKVKIIAFGRNIFVNPSWNFGARMAQGEVLCFLNDDLCPRKNIWNYVQRMLDADPDHVIGLIGMDFNKPSGRLHHSLCPGRSAHFGAMMFTRHDHYMQIPWPLKIWHGDDYLILMNRLNQRAIVHIQGYLGEQVCKQEVSISIDGYRFALEKVLKRDKFAWENFFSWWLPLRYQPRKRLGNFMLKIARKAKQFL